jgi:Family of unknown function (DUF6182)
VGHAPAEASAETTALVLMRSLDLADLVDGARSFAAALTGEEAEAWRRSWTQTRFVFGNPANLPPHTPARVVGDHGTTAWLGPFRTGRPPGLSRLFKPVTGVAPKLPAEIEFPGDATPGPRYREIRLALRNLTLAEYLVHLHHTLSESVLLGRLRPRQPIRLVHRLDLDAGMANGEHGYARVHYAPGDSSELRLYAWLSPDEHR